MARPRRSSAAGDANPAVAAPRLPTIFTSVPAAELRDQDEWYELAVTGELARWAADGVDIARCHLSAVQLTGSRLDGARIRDSLLDDCELSGLVLWEAALRRVALHRCRIAGLQAAAAVLHDVLVVDCKLDGANLRSLSGERVRFVSCSMVGVDLSHAQLPGARFYDCNLTRADVSGARLGGAQLHGSVLDDLIGARDLTAVTIDSTQSMGLGLLLLESHGIAITHDRD